MIVRARAEYQHVELKAARLGCPERFYDTLSSFSNRDNRWYTHYDAVGGYAIGFVMKYYSMGGLEQEF